MAHGLYTVLFHDNMVTKRSSSRAITLNHGRIGQTADILEASYGQHIVGRARNGEYRYLINGVYVEANRVTDAVDAPSEIKLRGESQTGLDLLAKSLGLPEIPQNAYFKE